MDPVIKEVDYLIAKNMIQDKSLIVAPSNTYYGVYIDGLLVCVAGVSQRPGCLKLQANYTPPEHRRKGYFSMLLDYIIGSTNQTLKADCLIDSIRIYERKGFTVYRTKQFKRFKVFYCMKEQNE